MGDFVGHYKRCLRSIRLRLCLLWLSKGQNRIWGACKIRKRVNAFRKLAAYDSEDIRINHIHAYGKIGLSNLAKSDSGIFFHLLHNPALMAFAEYIVSQKPQTLVRQDVTVEAGDPLSCMESLRCTVCLRA